jgi:hypothetical protein
LDSSEGEGDEGVGGGDDEVMRGVKDESTSTGLNLGFLRGRCALFSSHIFGGV